MNKALIIILTLLLSSGVALADMTCSVTGDGQLNDGGSVAGNAITNKKGAGGAWSHTTSDGNVLSGDVEWVDCRKSTLDSKAFAGFAEFGGSASWNGEDGYRFRVNVQDSGDQNAPDNYRILIDDVRSGKGEFVYRTNSSVENGNIQIHAKQ
jgi:hypothetical protein